MDAATTTMIAITLVILIALIHASVRRRRNTRRRPAAAPRSCRSLEAVEGRITLDVPTGEVDDRALRRLATQLAERALDRDPSLMVVEVVDLDGHNVLRLHREQRPRTIQLPESLHEPHVRPHRGPSPVPRGDAGGHGGSRSAAAETGRSTMTDPTDVRVERVEPIGARAIAARFDLPTAVRDELPPDADHAGVLEAILTVAGHPTSRDGDVVLLPHMAFIVADVRAEPERALSRAYLRLRRTGRAHGIVIRYGYVDPAVLARRARSAPDIAYTDTRALQRMADATALGLNPLDFIHP